MHYLMMVSEVPSMIYQAELLIKSVKKFSKGKIANFTLVIQGSDQGPIMRPLLLTKAEDKGSTYLRRNSDILFTPYHWELGSPCRWFVEPKSSMCIFIDVDVIACDDLSPIYELDQNSIHGVTALKKHLNDAQWSSIGLSEDDRKYYFNMGMLAVPSRFVKPIGERLFDVYAEMQIKFPEQAYYSGQISLSYIVKQMGLNRNSLIRRFNWFDANPYSEMEDWPIFFHYFWNNNKNQDLRMAFRNDSLDLEYKSMFEKVTSRLNIMI